MDELTYYTIKNLITKVINNIDNFDTINHGGIVVAGIDGYMSFVPSGIIDKQTGFEILEKDFSSTNSSNNAYRLFRKTFAFLYWTIAEKDVKLFIDQLLKEQKSKKEKIDEYLETTQYLN